MSRRRRTPPRRSRDELLADPDLPAALLAGLKRGGGPQGFRAWAWAAGLLPDDGRGASAAERVLERYKRDAVSPNLTLAGDRKSTRLNSSHLVISYAVFCLKKKKKSLSSHM